MSESFLEFIKNSALSKEDKDLWFTAIAAMLDENQAMIFEEFVDGKEENLVTLTRNIKAKTDAFKDNDEKMLDEILNIEQ